MTRFQLMCLDYHRIQLVITQNSLLCRVLDLPQVNEELVRSWHNKGLKKRQAETLSHGIQTKVTPLTTTLTLPEPMDLPTTLQRGSTPSSFAFTAPRKMAGEAKKRQHAQSTISRKVRKIAPTLPGQSNVFVVPQGTFVPNIVWSTPPVTSAPPSVSPSVPRLKQPRCFKHCGEIWTSEGNTNYMFRVYCPSKETVSVEEWKAALKDKGVGKRVKDTKQND
ncbi:PREDICTED: uncharacterized protein LOC106810481 [Priapulus caudatus]|uniref:Uncharacterized protein LOC106810481 n=1 Tax=Priapulus caudatus TaxID=37621 RepID=A0ABM1EAX4_PRICU|nr:PREDICTED: uncharacterized protein LOC106810481 [Priapulus caudatus]